VAKSIEFVPPTVAGTLDDIAGVGEERDKVAAAVPVLLTAVPDDSLNCNLINGAGAWANNACEKKYVIKGQIILNEKTRVEFLMTDLTVEDFWERQLNSALSNIIQQR